METEIDSIWYNLENEIKEDDMRRLIRCDFENESGIRLAITNPGNFRELLIQIDENDEYQFNPPNWVGMKFDILKLDVPKKNTQHISICLENAEHKRIFTTVCSDIAETLSSISDSSHRTRELKIVLDQWTRFFKNYGPEGLSPEAQRGLYGELTWLELLLVETVLDMPIAVESWQGYKNGYYDFELDGRVLEVKTTMTKEPRRVKISNERQLDDRGLVSLHLYVLTLQKLQSGGETLPEMVAKLRTILKSNSIASDVFEKALKKDGYFDFHEHNYTSGYVLKKQETFRVSEGFPRIINPPTGVGDISYSVTISACSDFLIDLHSAVSSFMGIKR
ncbi:PD-(D/E)XK motif protein [Methanolobus sp. WCC5]|uniref:PD-(D/E)XK motif protein n=1 Tax=Methanolobus sp. WCC5 TaxID=3125785 RepID=UPI00324607B6